MKLQIVKRLVTSLTARPVEKTTRLSMPNRTPQESRISLDLKEEQSLKPQFRSWALAAVSALALAATTHAQATLPVYRVVKSGATASQAAALAKQLGFSAQNVLSAGGAIEFVDASRYLSLPTATAPDSPLLQEAIAATRNKDSSRNITPTILNANAFSSLSVVPTKLVIAKTAAALAAAGLTPQFGKAFGGNHELSLFSGDGTENVISQNSPIDTEVTYHLTTPNGYPIYGPGAQVQVTFDSGGHVSRAFYAARRITPAGTVAVIPQDRVNNEIASMFPANSIVSSRLVYFAPPLATPIVTLIPWYAYSVTTFVTNQATGAVSEVKSKIGFLPATADTRFVPTAQLSAQGGSAVSASVSVQGGRPPYRYIWGGSNPSVSQAHTSTVLYTPQIRVAQALLTNPNFSLEHNDSLSVTVVDANGVAVFANVIVPVLATPLFPPTIDLSKPLFGSENPGDPLHWMPARVAWNTEMGTPGDGANLSFDWLGDSAWPGDFIRPTPAGTLVGTPWVFGDADFSNWGVDAADIVLDNADGWYDGTVLMQPGAPATLYATASITSPAFVDTVSINGNGFGVPASFAVNYNGSWGPIGPNDTLEWLLLDDCDMLDAADGIALNVAQRWGPAFGGLHILTGFASLDYGDGPFEGGVADNVLGIGGPAQTIVQSWFNSASATGAGNAAAMGPALEVAPGIYACDSDDYFWGKGSVGPTLNPSSYPPAIFAYWYLTTTTPMQYLF